MKSISELKKAIPLAMVLEYLRYQHSKCALMHCPFHNDSTPSMRVYADAAYCFGCGKNYDILDFVMYFLGLNTKEACKYLEKTFLNNENYEEVYADKERLTASSGNACVHSIYLAAIYWTVSELNNFTQRCVQKLEFPKAFYNFFVIRKFDPDIFLSTNYFQDNILFLHHRYRLVQFLNRQIGHLEMHSSGLMKINKQGQWSLCALNDGSYCLLFPVWGFDWTGNLTPIAIRVRNIDPASNYPKELDWIVRGVKRTHTSGFIGLKRAFNQYPQAVKNFCDGLTVFFCEGTTDFIAAHELIHKFNILGGDNENTIILTAGGVDNNTQIENLKLLKNCSRLIVAFDNDDKGEKGFFKVRDVAAKIGIKKVERYPLEQSFKDLNQYLFNFKKEF